jgi:hypothetical protein
VLRVSISRHEDPTGELRHRLALAHLLLLRHYPAAARRGQSTLKPIWLADIQAVPILMMRHRLVLGRDFLSRSSPEMMALVLSYAVARTRLSQFSRRFSSADRRAQYWRRVRREVAYVAVRLDEAEDSTGYVPGVSQGRWQQWTEDWLGARALREYSLLQRISDSLQDSQTLGMPRWLARTLATFMVWRATRSNER